MNRVKLLGLMAAATLMVASCNSDEMENSSFDKKEALSFGVKGSNSRGLVMTEGQMRNTGFGVMGYYTEQEAWKNTSMVPNYMYNQKIESFKTSWIYSPIKYWPSREGDKLTFFAYAPYELSPKDGEKQGIKLTGNDQTGAPVITFTTKDAPSDMVDFVTAVVYDKERDFTPGVKNTIDFEFSHELSRFSFVANNKTEGSFVNIKNAKLSFGKDNNVYKTATYTYPEMGDERGTWHFNDGVKFRDDYYLKGILNVNQNNVIGEGKDRYEVDGVLIASGKKADLFDGKYLFFIPANGDDGSNADAVTVTFDYDIVTPDVSVKNGFTSTSQIQSVTIPAGKFQQGISYTLEFNLDGEVVEIGSHIKSRSF